MDADRGDALDALRDVIRDEGRPVATAVEVAERLGCSRPTATGLLRECEAAGRVETAKVGRSRVWWPVSDSSAVSLAETPGETSGEAVRGGEDSGDGVVSPAEASAETPGVDVDSVEVPGSGEKAERRRDAVRACVEYLRADGEATPSGFQDAVYEEHDGGYASARSWWKNCVYPALRELSEDVEGLERADTSGRWRWKG